MITLSFTKNIYSDLKAEDKDRRILIEVKLKWFTLHVIFNYSSASTKFISQFSSTFSSLRCPSSEKRSGIGIEQVEMTLW